MAVTKSLPSVVVTVQTKKRALREYPNGDSPSTECDTVTKYIEAHSGSYFMIRIDIGAGTHFQGDSISFLVHVDGNETEFPFVMRTRGSATIQCAGALLPGNQLRKYRFEILQLGTVSPNDRVRPCYLV